VTRARRRKSLADLRPQARCKRATAAKKLQSVFSGGVYVGKNSARPANVRVAQRKLATRALQRAASPQKSGFTTFLNFLSLR
jgi:hypothetical protein